MKPVFRGVGTSGIADLDPDDSAAAERLGKRAALYDHVRIRGRRPPAPPVEPRPIPDHLADYLRRALEARAAGEEPPDLAELPGLPEINLALLLLPETRSGGVLEYRETGAVPEAAFHGRLDRAGGAWRWTPAPPDAELPGSYPHSLEFGENRIAWPPPAGGEAESLWRRGRETVERLARRMRGLPDASDAAAAASETTFARDGLEFVREGGESEGLLRRLLDRLAGRAPDAEAAGPPPTLPDKMRAARERRRG